MQARVVVVVRDEHGDSLGRVAEGARTELFGVRHAVQQRKAGQAREHEHAGQRQAAEERRVVEPAHGAHPSTPVRTGVNGHSRAPVVVRRSLLSRPYGPTCTHPCTRGRRGVNGNPAPRWWFAAAP